MNLMDFFITLAIKDRGVAKALNAVDAAAKKAEGGVQGAQTGLNKFNTDKAQKESKELENALKGLDYAAHDLGQNIKSSMQLVGAGLAAAFAGVGAFGYSVLKSASDMEVLRTSLETIQGSSEAADKSLAWITEFAAKTPFAMTEVAQAFKKLQSYGLDAMSGDLLKDLGNMASAMGKGLDQAVEAIADATTGEFERLKEFGVKAKKEGDSVTLTYNKNGKQLQKTVKNNAAGIQRAFQEIARDRFSGGMEKQSKTWDGMLSNLGDSWENFKRKIADGGAFKTIKSSIEKLLSWIEKNQETLDKFASVVGYSLVPVLILLGSSLVAVTAALIAFNVAMWANPITWIIAAIALLIGSLVLLAVYWDDVKVAVVGFVDQAVAKIDGLTGGAMTAIIDHFKLMADIAIYSFKLIIEAIGWVISRISLGIEIFKLLMTVVGAVFSFITNEVKGVGISIIDAFKSAFESVKNVFSGAWDYFKGIDWLAPIRPLLDGVASLARFAGISNAGQPTSTPSTTAPVNQRAGAAYTDNRTITVEVNANSVRDPAKVANMTAREIGNMRYAQ